MDFISDMAFVGDYTLLATAGDGCLSVFDIRTKKPLGLSDNQDDELLCLSVVKHGTKVVIGTQSGTLLLFSFGQWGDNTDRYPGHPGSIDSLLKWEEDVIFTGSNDGVVRECTILPNKIRRRVGQHADLPIEKMALTFDRSYVASCAHEGSIRFWETGEQNKDLVEHDRERDSEECDSDKDLLKDKQKHKRKKAKKGADPASSKSLFFSQMD